MAHEDEALHDQNLEAILNATGYFTSPDLRTRIFKRVRQIYLEGYNLGLITNNHPCKCNDCKRFHENQSLVTKRLAALAGENERLRKELATRLVVVTPTGEPV